MPLVDGFAWPAPIGVSVKCDTHFELLVEDFPEDAPEATALTPVVDLHVGAGARGRRIQLGFGLTAPA